MLTKEDKKWLTYLMMLVTYVVRSGDSTSADEWRREIREHAKKEYTMAEMMK